MSLAKNIDLFKKVSEQFTETLGPHWWFGADSRVWRVGRKHVIKLCCVRPEEWQTMRILSRRNGPIVRTLDMRVVGIHIHSLAADDKRPFKYIVGCIVQEYISMQRNGKEQSVFSDNRPFDRSPLSTKDKWFDGLDWWEQEDNGTCNAVEGRWVDLVRVSPVGRIRGGFTREMRKLGIHPARI